MPSARIVLVLLAGIVAVALAAGPPPLEAQARPDGGRQALEATEAALAEGRYPEARARIEAWWQEGEAGQDRADIQKAIWLRARLTVDPEAAELLYRRLVVEFPGGEFSDQALLRLSLGARARGEVDVARRYLDILIRDYPGSPYRVEARTALAQLDGARPSAPPAAVPGAGQAPSQTPAQVPPGRAQSQTPPAQAPRPPVPAPTPAPAQAPAQARTQAQPAGAFALQFGAFGQVSSAVSLSEELGRAGLDVRIVRVEGSPLIRVRLGRFGSREDAEAHARELRERGFEVLVSVDGDRETPVS
jgi:cell division septation protein DedD